MKNKKKYINPNPYKRAIDLFFDESSGRNLLHITNIVVYKLNKETVVEVTSHRPGLIIGKGGRTIDELKNFIERVNEHPIKFVLKESTLWKNIYKKY